MELLFDIPVVGLFFQLVDYLIVVLIPNLAPSSWPRAAPIALGPTCGLMNERSGVVNIGIEGMMLAAAFAGWFAARCVVQAFPEQPKADFAFGATPALLIGLLAAVLTGMAVSADPRLAVHHREGRPDHQRHDHQHRGPRASTGYLHHHHQRLVPAVGRQVHHVRAARRGSRTCPSSAGSSTCSSSQGPITMSVLVLAVVLQVLLFRSRWGLRTRAVGEHPKAAETVGVDVIRLRYRNVILGGIFAGLAGAYFTLDFGTNFQYGMTGGRGFIALAALIFGRWTPVGSFGAALLFAAAGSLSIAIRTVPPTGQLGDLLAAIPDQFWSALPYLVTIIVLAGVVGRSVAPAAVGKPYERESASRSPDGP